MRATAGTPPSAHEGRVAFLLAFGTAVELEVTPRGGPPEVVSMLFCGTSEDPLLVQRIGRNREAAARAEEAAPTGAGAAQNPNPRPNPTLGRTLILILTLTRNLAVALALTRRAVGGGRRPVTRLCAGNPNLNPNPNPNLKPKP